MYASVLSFVSVAGKAKWSTITSAHLVSILLAPWTLYVYRDVCPLCTFSLTPMDQAEGWLLWVKIALLTMAAVVIPLIMPRHHIPIDPEVRIN